MHKRGVMAPILPIPFLQQCLLPLACEISSRWGREVIIRYVVAEIGRKAASNERVLTEGLGPD